MSSVHPALAILLPLVPACSGGSGGSSGPTGPGPESVFTSPSTYPAPARPTAIVAGDLDANGALDLVVVGTDGAAFKVFEDQGELVGRGYHAAGDQPTDAAIADLNADGHADVVVAVGGEDRIVAYFGTRQGGELAAPGTGWAVGVRPEAIAVGDLDRDGVPDVVCANSGSGDLSILLGTGTGSMQPAVSQAVGPDLESLVLADVDLDGNLDAVVGASANLSAQSRVWTLLGRGDGTFAAPRGRVVAWLAKGLLVGDLDGDPWPDVAACVAGYLLVLSGQGDGTFVESERVPFGGRPQAPQLLDWNRDGIRDLIVANPAAWDVRVVLGAGGGEYADFVTYACPGEPSAIAVLDDDRVAVALGYSDLVLTGRGAPAFTTVWQQISEVVTDLDGDGLLDVVVSENLSGWITWLQGRGDGSFEAPEQLAQAVPLYGIGIGDLDGDGVADVAGSAVGSPQVAVVLGVTSGTPTAATLYPIANTGGSVVLRDLDGDTAVDVVVGHGTGVAVLRGAGDGSLHAPVEYPVGGASSSLQLARINGDSVDDVIFADRSSGNVVVLPGFPDGTFGAPLSSPALPYAWTLDVGDLNLDGRADVVVGGGSHPGLPNGLVVLYGAGDGTFGPSVQVPTVVGPAHVRIAQVWRNGRPDLLIAEAVDLVLYVGRPGGGFQDPVRFHAGGGAKRLDVGDLDQDGDTDVLVHQSGSPNRVAVYLNVAAPD